jgi:hypothetical protein
MEKNNPITEKISEGKKLLDVVDKSKNDLDLWEVKEFKFALNVLSYTMNKLNEMRAEIRQKKEDRLMKYFGSDGLVYKMKLLCKVIKENNTQNGFNNSLCVRYNHCLKELYSNMDFLCPAERIEIREEQLRNLLELSKEITETVGKIPIFEHLDNKLTVINLNQFIDSISHLNNELNKKTDTYNKKLYKLKDIYECKDGVKIMLRRMKRKIAKSA